MGSRIARVSACAALLLVAACAGPRAAQPPAAPAYPPAAAAASPAAGAPFSGALPLAITIAAAPVPAPIVDGARSLAVASGDAACRCVALTFDAGADAGHTTAILDLLAAERAAASFGVTGRWAEANPELLRRIVAGGYQLINHTHDHASLTGLSTQGPPLSRTQRWEQLDRAEAAFAAIAGVTARPYFRPPYGDVDAAVLADVGARGYTVTAMWSVDSLGWNGLPAAQIAERTLRLAAPGAILIFHVGSASADAEALPAIVRGLRQRGYTFVSIAALLAPVEAPPASP